MLLVELDWLQDAEFLGRIGRNALAVVLKRLAPVLARQGVVLPDALCFRRGHSGAAEDAWPHWPVLVV
jgi:hypothetical protein